MASLRTAHRETSVFRVIFPGVDGAIYIAQSPEAPPPSGWAVITERAGKRGDSRRITLCRSGVSARLFCIWTILKIRRLRGVRTLKGIVSHD